MLRNHRPITAVISGLHRFHDKGTVCGRGESAHWPLVRDLNDPQPLYIHELHKMPTEQRLDTAGPFVNRVFDVDRGIARRVRIPAMQNLGTAVVQRRKALLGQIAAVIRSKYL